MLGAAPVASVPMRRTASIVGGDLGPGDGGRRARAAAWLGGRPRRRGRARSPGSGRRPRAHRRPRHRGCPVANASASTRWVPMAARPCRGPLTAPMAASTHAKGLARVEAATRAASVEVASSWSASRTRAASRAATRAAVGRRARDTGPQLGGDRRAVACRADGRAEGERGAGEDGAAWCGPCGARCRAAGRRGPRRRRRQRRRPPPARAATGWCRQGGGGGGGDVAGGRRVRARPGRRRRQGAGPEQLGDGLERGGAGQVGDVDGPGSGGGRSAMLGEAGGEHDVDRAGPRCSAPGPAPPGQRRRPRRGRTRLVRPSLGHRAVQQPPAHVGVDGLGACTPSRAATWSAVSRLRVINVDA